jgi:hypothetical protein
MSSLELSSTPSVVSEVISMEWAESNSIWACPRAIVRSTIVPSKRGLGESTTRYFFIEGNNYDSSYDALKTHVVLAASLVFFAENAWTQDRNSLHSQSIDAVELPEMSRP